MRLAPWSGSGFSHKTSRYALLQTGLRTRNAKLVAHAYYLKSHYMIGK